MVIYKITNKLDNKIYIGQTLQNVSKRWIQHKSDARARKDHSVIHRAMNKHGIENFEITTITECRSLEEMNDKEQYFIALLKSLVPAGYNVSLGGENHKHSEETKKKLSAAKKGVKRGYTWNKGIPVSPETLLKLSLAQKGENNGMFGKKHSEETKRKIATKATNRKYSKESVEKRTKKLRKPILCHEINKIFDSCKSAAEYCHIAPQSVTQVAKGQRKQCYGLTFSFIN
jgi:group I intron endonuclease